MYSLPLSLPLSKDFDDPFYVMDVKKVADLYQLWRESLPSIKPYYGEY